MDAFGVLLSFGLAMLAIACFGVILFLTCARSGAGAIPEDKGERFVITVTAALAIWNVGVAFILGMVALFLHKRGLLGRAGQS
jgi:hypothetical protein